MNPSKLRSALSVTALLTCALAKASAAPVTPGTTHHVIAPEIMQRTYEQVKTPFKHGVVIKGEGGRYVDCPAVFRHDGRWLMMFIAFDGKGYETRLAESDDLRHFRSCLHPRLGLTKESDFHQPLYDLIQDQCSIAADQSVEEFIAVAADKRLARLLEVPVRTPLLRRERTVLDTGRKPVEFAMVHYRCDRFRLTLSLRQE